MKRHNLMLDMLSVVICCGVSLVAAGDWTKWRGPNGNGIVDASEFNPQSLAGRPHLAWQSNVGVGYAAVAVRGNRLYAIGNRTVDRGSDSVGMDTVYCLDARTGREIWRYSYPCTTDTGYPGPTASPVVDGDRLYTLSDDTGDLFCLDAETGAVRWKVNTIEAFGAEPPHQGFGFSGSPVIDGKLLLLNLNTAGIALDKMTGTKIWASPPGPCSYSTPVLFDRNERRKAALFGAGHLFILDVATGTVDADFDWDTFANENSADPLVIGNRFFISSAYDTGCALVELTKDGLKKVWQNKNLSNLFTSSVYLNGHIFGIDELRRRNSLRCLDPKTGDIKWSEKMDFSSLIAIGDQLLVLTERGELKLVEATAEAYRETASVKIAAQARNAASGSSNRAYWWTNPVLANGRLYIRSDQGDLVCLDVSR